MADVTDEIQGLYIPRIKIRINKSLLPASYNKSRRCAERDGHPVTYKKPTGPRWRELSTMGYKCRLQCDEMTIHMCINPTDSGYSITIGIPIESSVFQRHE